MLAIVDGQASAIGQSIDAKNLYRERLKLVVQVRYFSICVKSLLNLQSENSLAIIMLIGILMSFTALF